MPTGAVPREIYSSRLNDRTRQLSALESRRNQTGTLRLLVFLLIAATIWFAMKGNVSGWLTILPIAAFIALVSWQSRLDRACECTRRAIRFYEQGLARIDNRWHTSLPASNNSAGEQFKDPHHPYSGDLDLFGHASLFHLISTARTAGGEARLAGWLQAPAPPDQLRERHAAIEELKPLLDLREQLAVLGDDFRAASSPDHLAHWGKQPASPFPAWTRLAALVLSLCALCALGWWFGTDLVQPDAQIALIATGILEALIAVPPRTKILSIIAAVEEPAHDLALLSQILATLEKQQFQSLRLAVMRDAITTSGQPASRRIARLSRLAELLDSRDSPLVRAIGPVILWTTQLGMAIEAWRAENGPYVAQWLDAVSEMEALSSLANYAFEHPADPFPEFTETGPVFEGDDIGHPLLREENCVRNTVRLKPPLRLIIVSGSNMSGKSTLLRTIGINAVLAFAGAPVRATRLTISPLSVGASIHTTDSLEEGHSRFMAEILRLKQVLELPAPALFLLDELLGGTNSHDRALGSEGLIRALLDRGAIGLVTTHDLSLARVADELAPAADNVHFEDRLENNRLVFDYRMRPGVVTRSNALDLMRAVGLDV